MSSAAQVFRSSVMLEVDQKFTLGRRPGMTALRCPTSTSRHSLTLRLPRGIDSAPSFSLHSSCSKEDIDVDVIVLTGPSANRGHLSNCISEHAMSSGSATHAKTLEPLGDPIQKALTIRQAQPLGTQSGHQIGRVVLAVSGAETDWAHSCSLTAWRRATLQLNAKRKGDIDRIVEPSYPDFGDGQCS
jgi:hypothetical protein